jgi:hypothetical protein
MRVVMPIFGILLAPSDFTPYKHQIVQRVNNMILENRHVIERSVSPNGN